MTYQIEFYTDKVSSGTQVLPENTTPEEAILFAKNSSKEHPESIVHLYEKFESGYNERGMQELFRWGYKLPWIDTGKNMPWNTKSPEQNADLSKLKELIDLWANIIANGAVNNCSPSTRAVDAFRTHLCALVMQTHSTGYDPYDISENEAQQAVEKQNSNVSYLKKVAAFGIASAVSARLEPEETLMRIFLICT